MLSQYLKGVGPFKLFPFLYRYAQGELIGNFLQGDFWLKPSVLKST